MDFQRELCTLYNSESQNSKDTFSPSQANFGSIRHLGNVSYWTLDSDKGGWDRRGKRECYGAWVDECYWPTFVLILILFLGLFSVQFKCSVGKKILEIVGI